MDNSTMRANPRTLLRATEAVTNWRALAATLLGGLAVFLCVLLAGRLAMSSFLLGGALFVLALLVGLTAYSTVGIVLMRQAQQQSITLGDALLQAAFSVPRLLGVGVLMLLIFLGIVLAGALLLFVCQLPGIGTTLYGIVYPVLALALGVSIVGLGVVAFPLAAPAIWEGNSVTQTVARLLVIMRRRLLSVAINLLVLVLLITVLSGVVSVVIATGNMAAVALSGVVGIQVFGGLGNILEGMAMGAMGGMGGGMHGFGMFQEGPNYMVAFGFGSGLLFTLGAIVPALTAINGNCLIYLEASEGLSFDEAEGQVRAGVEEARRRTQEARERAAAQMESAKAAAKRTEPAAATAPAAAAAPAPAPQAATPAPLPALRACRACHAALGAEDQFCGECGTPNPM